MGGKITLRTYRQNFSRDERVTVKGEEIQPGPYVVLEVKDTGPGIPQDLRKKIFEPFFTTKTELDGTGLGLATSVEIIQKHGGFMLLDSTPGEGACFSIGIPTVEGTPRDVSSDREIHLKGNGERILLIDDEAFVREAFQLNLESKNYRVFPAACGTEAFAEAARHLDIALVLTDLHMPEMDGLTVTKTLKKLLPNAAFLGVSGHATAQELEQWKKTGVSQVLQKPVSSNQLVLAIEQALHPRKFD